MNKRELLKEIRIRARITNIESTAFLEAFCSLVGEQLASCGEFSIHGFGKFKVTRIKSRIGRVFGDEQTRLIPDYYQIRFKSFSALSANI